MTNSSKVLFSSMAAEATHNGAQRYAQRMRKTLRPLPLHTESSAEAAWWRYGSWLTGAALVLCALAMCLPRMQLPAGYHDFADQVAWGVLPVTVTRVAKGYSRTSFAISALSSSLKCLGVYM